MIKRFSVSAYIENKGAILLVDHVKQRSWVPPGGKIEPNESPIDALKREVREETGLIFESDYAFAETTSFQADLWRMHGLLAFHTYDVLPEGQHMCFSFLLRARHRSIKPCDEYQGYKWALRHEALALVTPVNVNRLLIESYSLVCALGPAI